MDDFEHVVRLAADSNAMDSFQLPEGDYQVRVKPDDGGEWTVTDPVVAEKVNDDPKLVRSNADSNADAFYVNPVGTWEKGFAAQHVGSADDTWGGTKECVKLAGRNKLTDIFEGSSTDANVLLMTDDANGDALFVDDIYSASPNELGLSQSRIARIDEIRCRCVRCLHLAEDIRGIRHPRQSVNNVKYKLISPRNHHRLRGLTFVSPSGIGQDGRMSA